jgi:cyclopropane fatty-acyl-phospholipid synthase-like methyltransferase
MMDPVHDYRLSSPAALRNRDPILGVLRTLLPSAGKVLEIASGTGEHIVHFAASFADLIWIPSDLSSESRASIQGWIQTERLPNVLAPLDLDAANAVWPIDRASAVIAINMVHISPWAATKGLFKGAARILPKAAPLLLYGPFSRSEETMAPTNIDFDADLRSRNPEWGIRSLDDVVREAAMAGLRLEHSIEMPANNLCVVFERTANSVGGFEV